MVESELPQTRLGRLCKLLSPVYDQADAMEAAGVPIWAINSHVYPTAVEAIRGHALSLGVILIEDVGHFPQIERPKAFQSNLRHVVERLTVDSGPGRSTDPVLQERDEPKTRKAPLRSKSSLQEATQSFIFKALPAHIGCSLSLAAPGSATRKRVATVSDLWYT